MLNVYCLTSIGYIGRSSERVCWSPSKLQRSSDKSFQSIFDYCGDRTRKATRRGKQTSLVRNRWEEALVVKINRFCNALNWLFGDVHSSRTTPATTKNGNIKSEVCNEYWKIHIQPSCQSVRAQEKRINTTEFRRTNLWQP